MLAAHPTTQDLGTATDILVFARAERAASDASEANVLKAALAWADAHGTQHLDEASTHDERDALGYLDTGLTLGGEGCPLVSEFTIAEFAAALSLSTESGKHLIGQALELAHRLPRIWARVSAGEVQAWRARRIADQTMPLTREAAGFVDAQVAHVAGRTGPTQVERLVEEAVARFMPDEADAIRAQAADGRHVTVHTNGPAFEGTAYVEGSLDLLDALDLDRALNDGAAMLKDLGVVQDLDVRRSMALGELARAVTFGEQTLDHPTETDGLDTASPRGSAGSTTKGSRWSSSERSERVETRPKRPTRDIVLYIHLSQDALLDETHETECARIAGRGLGADALVTADTVRAWLGASDHPTPGPDLKVTVRPVIDLADHVHTDAYEITDRQREHLALRDQTCVFPYCRKRARQADCDHIHNWSATSPTCTCNLAVLCRRHHRLKTHGHGPTRWTYEQTSPGVFVWTSPHGATYLRDHRGTHRLEPTTSPPRRR